MSHKGLYSRFKKSPSGILYRLRRGWRRALRRKKRLSNKEYIQLYYKKRMGCEVNLDNPQAYTEKLQWMKLWYNDPRYSICADKVAVRQYVTEKGYKDILTPCYGVYEYPEQIDLDSLPDRFVIKANHGCGWNLLCKDKDKLRKLWKSWNRIMNQWLVQDYSIYKRELHYAHIPPRLICEQFLENSDGREIQDYKFFCFHGEPKVVQVDNDRFANHQRNYYDANFNLVDLRTDKPNNPVAQEKPVLWERMVEISRVLSADFPHVRVDLYEVDGKIYFGELTFVEGGGYVKYYPPEYNYIMGAWFELPDKDSPFVVRAE